MTLCCHSIWQSLLYSTILFLKSVLIFTASAEVTDTLDEFDNEFNSKILVDGDEEKKAEAKQLKKAEDEINK